MASGRCDASERAMIALRQLLVPRFNLVRVLLHFGAP